MTRALTWSYGGGTQSVAIAVLVAQGKLPAPALAVMADTGHERQRTWEYTERYVHPLLARVGVKIEVAPHALARVGLFAKGGKTLIPAFAGPDSKLDTFCSNEWKKRVFRRFLRARGFGPTRPVVTWLGYSVDEVGRATASDVRWQEYQWPLLFDVPMRREECRALIESAGLPSPPRSSCYFCPLHRNEEWREIRDHEPADWAKAVKYDALFYDRNGVRLHRSMAALAEANIDAPDGDPDQLGLVGDGTCSSGFCFV